MNKNQLIELRKSLVALGLAGIMLGTAGCTNNNNSDDGIPSRVAISSEYSHPEDFYKYAIVDGEAVKLYDGSGVYLFFDKETYEAKEYLFRNQFTLLGDGYGGELYDLESEELLVYSSGISTAYNKEYFEYLMENNYAICLSDLSYYVEDYEPKEAYTLDEIRELEPLVAKGVKLIIEEKSKTK